MANVAPGPPSTSVDRAAMGAHQFGGDREAEAGAARATGPWKARKSDGRACSGTPGPVSSTLMETALPSRAADDRQPADHRRAGIALHRLDGVAARD